MQEYPDDIGHPVGRDYVSSGPPTEWLRKAISGSFDHNGYRLQVASASSRRRAAHFGPGVLPVEWLRIVEDFGGVCFYCGDAGPLTRDHFQPISRGGVDAPCNVVPACKSCNSAKGSREIDADWMAARRARRRPL